MPGACSGIRVLDCSRGASGALAAMVLSDFGADVIRFEPEAPVGQEIVPADLLLHRGKRSVRFARNDAADRAMLLGLAPSADVLIEDWGPGVADGLGLGDDVLSAANPALVRCSVSGFGTTGPYAGTPADDDLVMAKAGILRDQPGWEQDGKRPIYRSCPDGSYFAGMLAALGATAALRARDLTGRGQRIDANMLRAITCRQNPQVRWLLREGEDLPLDRASSTEVVPDAINPLAHHRDPREVTLTGMLVQCADDRWIMHSLSEPHFFPAWIDAIGFGWIWEDDRFKGAPWRFPDADAKVELVTRLQARMKEKTSAEWIEDYLANGNVCADVIQTTQEALRHPQLQASENLVEVEDPRVGRIIQIGPIAKISGAPASVERPAPIAGQHTDEVIGEPRPTVTAPAASTEELLGPLDGITIIECGYYYATPFATALLAELGARVIKVEPITGDPYRLLGRGGGDPVTALGHNNMVRAMQGKESIALNLKDSRGRRGHSSLGFKSRPVRPQLSRKRARSTWDRRQDPPNAEPQTRVPVCGLVWLHRTVCPPAGHRPRHCRIRRPDCPPDRRWQPAASREWSRPRRCCGTCTVDGTRTVRRPPDGQGSGRRVVDDRLEPVPQLRGRALVRR